MRISQIILRVADLDASLSLWSGKVGFDVAMASEAFAFLDGGGVQLALNQVDSPPDDVSLTEIVIEFEDVRGAYADLAGRGVPFEIELRPVTSSGERDLLAAHFYDPDRHLGSVVGWVDRGG